MNPERKGNVGEWGWVKDRKELSVEGGGCSTPSFIVTSLGNLG